MRSATTATRNAQNYAHRNNHCCKTHRRNQTTQAAPAAHTRYLSSSPAATLHGKTQGFVLRLPPQLNTSLRHHSPSSSLTSHRHHVPSSPLPFVTTSILHHFPSSPLPFVTTPVLHHFPSSPLPFVTTSLLHHFPSSPLPFVTTPLHHHFPSSPLPFFTTSLRHHFPSSPLPFLTTSFVTTPLHHHFPSSPLPFVTTPLHHHFPSSATLCHSFLFFCYVLSCDLAPFIKVNCIASCSFVMYCYICIVTYVLLCDLPVVPHKAVAEVSKIGNL